MIGKTVSHYRITDKLGEGGMGEVYRAEDSQLGRDVAIKVLPEAFVADAQRLARFEREARLLAALDHPNIAGIYGLEEVDGERFLVMQVAEGETLQERIARGPIPTEEALKIGRQVAEALEAAHAKGIIHRDLKPANVKVTPEGVVKVLDFGLAKAIEAGEASSSSPSISASPTLTAQMTEAGVLLGTAAYMSPEQARGESADKRADLWAFGVLMWEMLTGNRLFTGKTVSDTLAGVLRDQPEFDALPHDIPPSARRLLRRCLEREPHERLADAGAARLEIEDALAGRSDIEEGEFEAAAAQPGWKTALPWVLLAATAAALIGSLVLGRSASTPPSNPVRLEARLSEEELYVPLGSSVVLSPDGSQIAYATNTDEAGRLLLRSLDQLEGVEIEMGSGTGGNETPYHPFFSPDGQWLGFAVRQELKKVPVTGGTAITLTRVNRSRGASWGPDDRIVVAAEPMAGLSIVPAAGGDLEPLTTLNEENREISHRWPHVLPDGTAVIFTVGLQGMSSADDAIIEAVDLETRERKVLIQGGYYGQYVPTGHLIFGRSGTLFAVPFDAQALELKGSPAPVVEGVFGGAGPGGAQYSFSPDGTLAYVPGKLEVGEYPVVWVDRTGQTSPLWDRPASYASPRFSPQGDRLGLSVLDGDNWDVWVYDLEREVATRLTFNDGYDADQIWSPDGRYLYFTSDRDGVESLYKKPADGSGEVERLTESELSFYPIDISPDESVIIGETFADNIGITVFSLAEGGEPQSFLAPEFMVRDPTFSPDGKWVAYSSNESGRFEIYVRPFPAAGGRWQISNSGGRYPTWSKSGRELFYRTADGIMVTDVDASGGSFQVGKSRSLFEGDFQGGMSGIVVGGFVFHDFDVAPDGQRFVMFPDEDEQLDQRNVVLVFNWFDELRKTLPVE